MEGRVGILMEGTEQGITAPAILQNFSNCRRLQSNIYVINSYKTF
ncbi:hypothetical protein JTT01_18205 [Clostridium botulinum]|nr:hypothetical protein [Clostridium botulinum]